MESVTFLKVRILILKVKLVNKSTSKSSNSSAAPLPNNSTFQALRRYVSGVDQEKTPSNTKLGFKKLKIVPVVIVPDLMFEMLCKDLALFHYIRGVY